MSDSELTLQTLRRPDIFYRNYVHHSCLEDNSAKIYFINKNIRVRVVGEVAGVLYIKKSYKNDS